MGSDRKIQNILIRKLNDADREVIDKVKKETGCYQASKALLTMCYSYFRLLQMHRKSIDRVAELEKENKKLKELTDNIISSTKGLLLIVDNNNA